MIVRDPRGDKGLKVTNPQTGTAQPGGIIDVAGIDLGNGTCALATIAVTRSTSSGPP